jgi:beta-lactamase class A
MKRIVLVMIVAIVPLTLGAQGDARSGLTRALEAELARLPAKGAVYIKHLGTGEEAAVRADDSFNSFSVIKLPIMVRAFELADQKQLDLSERHVIVPADFRGGSGILRHHDPGWNPTWRDLIIEMIITSDNTATDLVLGKIGGLNSLNQWLQARGFTRTQMVMTLFDFFRKPYELRDAKYKSVTPEELLRMQTGGVPLVETREERIARDKDPGNWLGRMTPRETGRLLEGIERGTLVSKAGSDEMKRIMRAQQAGARRMPHFLPPGYAVAHKTGDGPPIIANDVGMVYAHSGTIVMAFFTAENRGLWQDVEDEIGRATRLVVDYFDGGTSAPQ